MGTKRSASSGSDGSNRSALSPAPTLTGWAGYARGNVHERMDESRRLRSMPRRRPAPLTRSNAQILSYGVGLGHPKTRAFTQYRNVSNITTSSDDLSEGLSPDEVDTGTALSDVESEIFTEGSSPISDNVDDEGDLIDIALMASPKSNRTSKSCSPSPIPLARSWRVDLKGKGVDPREHPNGKRQRATEDTGSGSEGDDESASITLPHKKKRIHRPDPLTLAKTNFGPTRSILDITMGIDLLGESELEISYSSADDDDARLVSASLLTLDEPMPGPKTSRSKSDRVANRVVRRQNARLALYAGLHANRSHTRPRSARRQYLRPASNGLVSDEEKMITSDIEAEMLLIDNEVQRRKRCRDFPERLPGQSSSAKLRRLSPTSLLPMRERRKHLRTAKFNASLGSTHQHPLIGQVMLAVMCDAREARDYRRRAVKAMNAKFDFANTSLLPPFDINESRAIVRPMQDLGARRTSHQRQGILRKRMARDQRRVAADRRVSEHYTSGPVRMPAPILSPSFVPLGLSLLASPDSVSSQVSIEIEEDDVPSVRSASPTPSDPPEYEEPPMPITLPLPAHIRPRPPPRQLASEVPAYPWLSQLSGGQYTRLSPPPPPPFNAQTDAETLVAPRFIDDDEDDDEMLQYILPGSRLNVEHSMVGAFPARQSASPSSSPTVPIISPTPVRWSSPEFEGRSPWEAALDLEEGEEDEDIIDEAFEAEEEEQSGSNQAQASEPSAPTRSVLGRLIGRVWRW